MPQLRRDRGRWRQDHHSARHGEGRRLEALGPSSSAAAGAFVRSGRAHGSRPRRGRHVTEDELYTGITEALTIAGWRWYHVRRSDGVSEGTGARGLPDIIAVHPYRSHLIMWELKGEG